MKQPFHMQKSVLLIITLLMLAFLWVFKSSMDTVLTAESSQKEIVVSDELDWGVIESEARVFSKNDDAFKRVAGKSFKKIGSRVTNRAYPGAPPQIPHSVTENVAASGESCLSCHRSGGYAAKFKAYAPIAPHPHFTNCRQCHTTKLDAGVFRPTTWVKNKNVSRGFSYLQGSPPTIPHPLHLRSNCLSCHAGASAIAEIRTTHPERENCRQCHVPVFTEKVFSRQSQLGGQQ